MEGAAEWEEDCVKKNCKIYFETASNTDFNTEKRGKISKPALAKRFKSELVTKLQISDPEVQDILDTAIVNDNKYYDDNSDN